ncbi:thiamine pyrophosphate-dependent enzyme [Fretibacter rubidus]|uniref:thiamine pyrophosphate-dependent enzyme n=1 Tax=Fretibacter rubidus TaxID=570162 RepID=UPI00352A0E0B
MFDRAKAIDEAFIAALETGTLPAVGVAPDMSDAMLADVLDTQIMNRHLDLMARRTKGQTFYSIGSSGHDGTLALALASRNSDMAFLHYRDAAFCIQRRKAVTGSTPLYDMILSFAASSDDPVSGGRHKVLGGLDIMTPPQTSTIASHLPKAVGAAHSLCLGQGDMPSDSVILCTFGDASSNHSTAQGAINAAAWAAYQGSPMPLVFVCEDNDIGISVRTPKGWIAANYSRRPGLHYIACDGTDIADAMRGAKAAVNYARARRRPVFLHMKTVRLMGHAGADIEAKYTSLPDIETREAGDPLLKTAAHVVKSGIMSTKDMLGAYHAMRARIDRVAADVFTRPKLETAEAIMAPIADGVHKPMPDLPSKDALASIGLNRDGRQIPLNKMLNKTLAEVMLTYDKAFVFGEDVARKGGVYGVTLDLLKTFGAKRVQDTLLDEQTILGMAIGAAQNGFLPIPEIQFLAYLHNAEDQIRGEAATLSFFSNGQFTNPMVIRIAGLGYQRGFGGHFHNDNSVTVLRDIPGLIVACPSGADDARKMLREVTRLAHVERRVCVFLEPIALYGTTDIHDGDKAWTGTYVPPHDDEVIKFGEVGQYGEGTELAILTYGNGYYLSRQADKDLGMKTRIIDIRWLAPLPMNAILQAVKLCKHILIVDECRRSGSLSEEIMAQLIEHGITAPMARVTGHDSFIPLGNAAYAVMPSVDDIKAAAEALCGT